MQIAPLQKEQLDFLRNTLKSIDGAVDRSSREKFRAITDRLDTWAARIAVIGQVKAGKSTFLNAFIHQPGFLPSDINPWTSVVTNMRVNVPGDPPMGASFEFFGEEDWNEMIHGNDHIRKMTEELLPGFDTEVLKKQSAEMRERAQRRLGNHYHALLGSKHDYDFVSPDLLQRYVCAGPGSDEGLEREALGRYAALTREAKVYMRMPEFLVPAIITDTPGVNDPFLVRDEFTCRSLDKSDIFIVVLSAHQALTDIDIALIRMLAQQDDKDVIVFINRIDELENMSVRVEKVVADVSDRLSKAIPDIEFTILAGSAHLAELTIRSDDTAQAERDGADSDDLKEYLIDNFDDLPEDQIDRLYLASGLTDLKRTLSTVIDNGVGCQQLNRILEDIRAEVNGARMSCKSERDSVHMQIESVSTQQSKKAIEALEQEAARIEMTRDSVDERLQAAEQECQTAIVEGWTALESDLNKGIRQFIEKQRQCFRERVVRDTVANTSSTDVVEIDLMPLQVRMESIFKSGFEGARERLDDILADCLQGCWTSIGEDFDEGRVNISLEGLPYDSFSSTLTLSKKKLHLDLVSERNFAFWRKKKIDVEKSIEALEAIALAEMRAPLQKLLAAFSETQSERVSAGCDRIRVLQRLLDGGHRERMQRLKKDRQALGDPEMQKRMATRLQSQLEVLDRRIQGLAICDSSLSKASMLSAA